MEIDIKHLEYLSKLKIEDDLDIEFIDVVELETTLHEE